jgi:hypothetical protein
MKNKMFRKFTKAVATFLRTAFTPPANFANGTFPPKKADGAADGGKSAAAPAPKTDAPTGPVPASTGDTFDFRKMLLQLLGLPDDAQDADVTQAYNSCMATEPDEQTKAVKGKLDAANQGQATAEAGAATHAAAAHAAVAKLAEAQGATTQAQGQAQQLKAANEALVKRCELAEGAFANERNSHIETMCNAAVITGRLTKAEATTRQNNLAGAKTPAEFETMVNEISALPPKLSMTSQTAELERTIAPGTASGKFLTMVNEAHKADPKHGFEWHWSNCGKSAEGKSLLDSMRKPLANPAFEQKPK